MNFGLAVPTPRKKSVIHHHAMGEHLMVVLEQSLDLEHRLALTNLATDSSNAAVVVWKGNPRPDGWEYGIELVAPEMDFWGIEL